MTDAVVYGEPTSVASGVARIIAPNPSPMTHWGTNTFLVGTDALVVIDPGPMLEAHHTAITKAVSGRPVTHILVTHSHLDHSPLAKRLSDDLRAPICAFGPSGTGRRPIMQELADGGMIGGGEGVDPDFAPHVLLRDRDTIETGAGQITAIHTPGHYGNHMSFQWRDLVFCGDHVMGWASSLVSPPDGDLSDFLASCDTLARCDATRFLSGHGDAILDPVARLDWLVQHRQSRTDAIMHLLQGGPASAADLTIKIYHDTPAALLPAAERNVLAHLIYLTEQDRIRPIADLHAGGSFRLN
ncbi:MBL fold metallo-hydrolase [Yoonia litorea]|uniref:Glyoxylase, beta-lactamase superfamily II n=1 Tax=Yoonia litorea TaxID=1123755 RepID=A0A1I6M792_9RHOB|nr:MBL fold metallo-hydrolase [Yoonia litorea]SFS11382.1 Glyoxylase, beta-lactamase superfamily II [Yoonia litorea]